MRFQTTRWSVILTARAHGEPGSGEALARLCETYWYPLYFLVRRLGHGADESLDLTQGYFLSLLERDALSGLQPEAGKFRSFLLASVKHYLANQRRRERAGKRGGNQVVLSLDGGDAERRYAREPPDDRTPERAYERQWALGILRRADERLQRELEQAGKGASYRVLRGHLTGRGAVTPYRIAAGELGISEAGVKMAVMRLRRRFGKILREEIAQTVTEDAEIDAEIAFLLRAMREDA